MRYERHATIDHYLNKVRLHTEPYITTVLEKDIVVYPYVMSPKYDRSSRIFISMMPKQKGKDFLEIGSGSGIVSVFAALAGANQVIAADINEYAIKNTEENFRMHNITNGVAIKSDLFQYITGTFDTIFFNAPFHGNKPMDILEKGTSDEDYRTLKHFFRTASQFLKPHGEILLGFSDMGDIRLLKQLIKSNSLTIKDFKSEQNGDWTAYFYTITKNEFGKLEALS